MSAKFLRYIRSFRYLPNALTKDTLIGVEPDSFRDVRPPYAWLLRRKTIHFIPVASNIPNVEMSEEERTAFRKSYVGDGRKMVVSFGFAFPHKGLDLLFQIADPSRDTLVLIMALDPENDPYHRSLMSEIHRAVWKDKVIVTGFLEARQVGRLLSAADAIVFPFKTGVAPRYGSFMAAKAQGTFTITTSRERQGFDSSENVFYAQPNDVDSMRNALSSHIGLHSTSSHKEIGWPGIAAAHVAVYRQCLER